MLHKEQFAATIFSATQRYNIVFTLFPMAAILFQHLNNIINNDWEVAHPHSGSTFPGRIGIWKCWFLKVGENRRTRSKTSRSRGENQQQTQPKWRQCRDLNPGHIGGRKVPLSPLRHPLLPKKKENSDIIKILWHSCFNPFTARVLDGVL